MNESHKLAGEKFQELVDVMQRLRAPGGCPWDRKQSFASIKTYLLEEAYEVMDAIDENDWKGLEEELGDLLLQPVFFAQMAAEEGRFTIADSLDRINQKLIRRHPHVFGGEHAETAEAVKVKWDAIKQQEKADFGVPGPESLLDAVPRSLPALMEAEKVGKKAADQGFDWPDVHGALEKVTEEAAELVAAQASREPEQIEAELGDLLFTIVNVARHLKIDPEQALRKTNARFRSRFRSVERAVARSGQAMHETSLDVLEEYWQTAKREARIS